MISLAKMCNQCQDIVINESNMKLIEKLLKPFKKKNSLASKQDLNLVIELNKNQINQKNNLESKIINFTSKEKTEDLTSLSGIGPKTAELLLRAGYTTKSSIINANNDEILKIKGISLAVLARLRKEGI